jgi:ankyrin repeat protein
MKKECLGALLFFFTVSLIFPIGCITLFKTELTDAAASGNIARVQTLITRGANINETNRKGLTPLMWAICAKQTQTAQKLVDLGANINIQDKYGYSALSYAILYGNVEMVNYLVGKGADLKQKDSNNYSYLHIASSQNKSDIVEILLKSKMNINEKNSNGETPLHLALSHRTYEVAKLLVDNGADINARDNYRSTPLHYTVRYGSYASTATKLMNDYILTKDQNTRMTARSMIDYLLSKNPDTNLRDSAGYTPLRLAVYYKNEDLANVLRARSNASDEDNNEEAFIEFIEMDDTTLSYRVIKQTAGLAERIKETTEFKIRDIDYSAVNAKELGYTTDEEWEVEKSGIPKTFADSFLKLLKEEGGVNKKIAMIKSNENINDGVVVDLAVKRIVLNWNYFGQKPDLYLCDINFTDSRNGQQLFSGEIIITTRDAGRMILNGGGGSMSGGGSMHAGGFGGYAGVGFGIPVNPFMPGWEGTFSGRLHIAAYNMAWIVTKIIIDGKIDPTEQ